MNQQLEADLREAFATRVSLIPADAVGSLRETDYHPRSNRVSSRLTVGMFGGAAVITGAIVSVVVLGGEQAAFAGWSPTPTLASTGETGTADAQCQAQLAAIPVPPGFTDGSAWNSVVTDVRGPFSVVIYGNGISNATCFTGPSFTVVSRSTSSGGSRANSVSVEGSGSASGSAEGARGGTFMETIGSSQGGGLGRITTAHLSANGGDAYTLVEGQVDSTVTGVTLLRSDGEDVQATVASGWLVAWWPGSEDATSAQVTTASGTTTQPLTAAPLPLLPPSSGGGKCSSTTSQTTCSSSTSQSAGGGTSGSSGSSTNDAG
jgi:hypothetical protein